MTILLGEFNAKVCGEDTFKPTSDNEFLHEISNGNRDTVVKFATSKYLALKSTMSHIVTFINLLGHLVMERLSHMDHILKDRRRHSNVHDVQPFRAADCDIGHYLAIEKFREILKTNEKTRGFRMEMFNLKKLKAVQGKADHSGRYYLGTQESKPGQRHLYKVHDPATDDPRRLQPQCVTCDLGELLWSSRYWYTNCTHFTASVSPGNVSGSMSYYVLECEGPGLPLAGVHSAGTHRLLRILYNTRPQRTPVLKDLALPKMSSFEVPLSQGFRAQVQLLLPPSWREELRDAAFPVLVEVNGRPGSQAVSEKFSIDWGTYMSSHNDVVYVKLDVRGSRGQGSRSLYRRLGGVEVQDQITVLRYLLDNYKFLDETRVGVWGWGYGGYVTAMLLGSQQNIFKCGIAVSPIADWLYYNSAFTERILGVPGENYKGYVEADATQRAQNVPSHSMYLLHGLADITAPYQHGVALARALAEAGIIFRYQSYADEGHLLAGVLEHVYRSMEDFLQECLSLDEEQS
ncbi:hypothetical protein B7P43_G00742 [Cryptotermes secundus]|uniref:Venom dipeptidyl peptidase 4 n=1 Tax=Cryptotermes secundus TaxID=105785 RepID=A0A2J7Q7T0_9NEOP|nr:hypothetical protein B7P43_G00742 [Cryptotermes secundus]